ncbi:polyubiquitin-B-like isoform X1 [Scomber scombrus]|uniref:polyubiquitin-B-like isoform X1 n=1 Tax=Scomber scombrus TaxID=13677 RepID=UPI002DD8B4BD|nr:polyubiquitin-B-like isoform X1 [Scomber scombrus]
MDINITMLDGTSLNLRVRPTDTVGYLKTLIQQKLGFAPEIQKLTFVNGKTVILNDDFRSINFYGLDSSCQVSLLLTQPPQPATIQVFLRKDSRSNTYDIKPDETVSNFRRRVQTRERVPNDQFRLVHESQDMREGKLSDYNVRANSTIDLTLRLRGGWGHFDLADISDG